MKEFVGLRANTYSYLIDDDDEDAKSKHEEYNTEEYNPYKEHKVLIVSDDMIADMLNNKKLNLIVAQLFIRSRKLNISLVFITQPFFAILKSIRLHSTHYFIMKILKKQQLKQFSINHSSDIDFMNLYKKMY